MRAAGVPLLCGIAYAAAKRPPGARRGRPAGPAPADTSSPTAEPVVAAFCTGDTENLYFQGYMYRTLYNASIDGSTPTGCDEMEYAQMPMGFTVAHDDDDIVSNVIAAYNWATYRLCTETKCWSTKSGDSIGITPGEMRNNDSSENWETDGAGQYKIKNTTASCAGDNYQRLLIRKACRSCGPDLPHPLQGPFTSSQLKAVQTNSSDWPADFCIVANLTTPPTPSVGPFTVAVALGPGGGSDGSLIVGLSQGKFTMGVTGGTAGPFQLLTSTDYTPEQQYVVQYCLSAHSDIHTHGPSATNHTHAKTHGDAYIFVDGVLFATEANFPAQFSRNGDVSLFTTNHENASGGAHGTTLHSINVECESGNYETDSPTLSPLTAAPTVNTDASGKYSADVISSDPTGLPAVPAIVKLNGNKVKPMWESAVNVSEKRDWINSLGLKLTDVPRYIQDGFIFALGDSVTVASSAEVSIRCAVPNCDFYIYQYHQPPQSSSSNGQLPLILPSQGWQPSSCAPRFACDSNPECMYNMVSYRKQATQSEATEEITIGATDAKYAVVVVKASVKCDDNLIENADECKALGGYCAWDRDNELCRDDWCPRLRTTFASRNVGGDGITSATAIAERSADCPLTPPCDGSGPASSSREMEGW